MKKPQNPHDVSHLLIKKVSKSQLHPAFFLSLFLLLEFFLILEEDINTIYINNNIKNKENLSIKRQHMGIVYVYTISAEFLCLFK